ncbi:MAG: TlpA family protein disulfide reductase [Flavobacteriales bacterium]|nr:TlpA family protein disulfide reductase [Flavobacteriales bacterium]
MRSLVIAISLGICSLSAVAQSADSTKSSKDTTVHTTKSDKKLPDITLKNTDGENVNLQSYGQSGKITIISFWATWCGPCIKELRNLNEVIEDWEENYNVQLVAVSVDDSRTTSKAGPKAVAEGWDFDILLDVNSQLALAMNVTNPPVTFLVDQSGNIVYTHTGYIEGDEIDLEEHIKELQKK